jgi:excisionase family DNA binding protein
MAERTLYVWVQQGKVPAFKIGVTWRFRRADIDAWLEAQRAGPIVDAGRTPLTDPVEPSASKFRIRRQEEQADQALIDACRAFIETTMRTEDRQVFVIDQFVDRFGQDVVDTVVDELRKKKVVTVTEERGLDGEMVKVLKRRR